MCNKTRKAASTVSQGRCSMHKATDNDGNGDEGNDNNGDK